MGFSENGSKRAAVATNNGNVEAAMEWVLAHMEEPSFNDPLPTANASADAAEAISGTTIHGIFFELYY
jgi:ubiquitin carboxyl-terminal hydrolase 5/13